MRIVATTALCATSLIFAQSAAAANWQAASGNWTNAANWGGSLPVNKEICSINNDGTCRIDSVIPSATNRINVGSSAGTLNKLEILPGAVHTNEGIRLGSAGSATGTVEQSGGWIWSKGWQSLTKGCTWTTSGGYFRNPGNGVTTIDGGGSMIQTGGTNYLHTVRIGNSGAADGTALYEISGGYFDTSWTVTLAYNPTVHSVFHIIGSQATVKVNGNGEPKFTLNGTNAELHITLDASGVSPLTVNDGGGVRNAVVSNGVFTVNTELFQGELLASTVTVIQADNIYGTFSRTNFEGNVKSAEVFVEGGDLKIRDIILRPKSTVIMIR